MVTTYLPNSFVVVKKPYIKGGIALDNVCAFACMRNLKGDGSDPMGSKRSHPILKGRVGLLVN